jgi:predicted Zn-dependent peptidase
MNEEVDTYLQVTPADLHRCANQLFQPNNSATLIYVPG